MTLTAAPRATRAVALFIDRVNAHVYGDPSPKNIRKGVKLASKRMAAKRKANKAIPDNSNGEHSRQVIRRMARQKEKSIRSNWKRSAMAKGIHGGSAIVR